MALHMSMHMPMHMPMDMDVFAAHAYAPVVRAQGTSFKHMSRCVSIRMPMRISMHMFIRKQVEPKATRIIEHNKMVERKIKAPHARTHARMHARAHARTRTHKHAQTHNSTYAPTHAPTHKPAHSRSPIHKQERIENTDQGAHGHAHCYARLIVCPHTCLYACRSAHRRRRRKRHASASGGRRRSTCVHA